MNYEPDLLNTPASLHAPLAGAASGVDQFGLRLPLHTTYIETRGSLGAMLFHKPRSNVEVLNDLDGEAHNLSQIMMEAAARTSLLTAFLLGNTAPALSQDDRLSRAIRFTSSLEVAASGYRKSISASRRAALTRCGAAIGRVDRLFDHLRDVQVERATTVELLHRYDWRGALFVCDERDIDWSEPSNHELARALGAVSGKVILITRAAPFPVAEDCRWHRHSTLSNVWTNYKFGN